MTRLQRLLWRLRLWWERLSPIPDLSKLEAKHYDPIASKCTLLGGMGDEERKG